MATSYNVVPMTDQSGIGPSGGYNGRLVGSVPGIAHVTDGTDVPTGQPSVGRVVVGGVVPKTGHVDRRIRMFVEPTWNADFVAGTAVFSLNGAFAENVYSNVEPRLFMPSSNAASPIVALPHLQLILDMAAVRRQLYENEKNGIIDLIDQLKGFRDAVNLSEYRKKLKEIARRDNYVLYAYGWFVADNVQFCDYSDGKSNPSATVYTAHDPTQTTQRLGCSASGQARTLQYWDCKPGDVVGFALTNAHDPHHQYRLVVIPVVCSEVPQYYRELVTWWTGRVTSTASRSSVAMYTDSYARNLESIGLSLAGLAMLPNQLYMPDHALYRDTHKRTFGNLDVFVLHGKFSMDDGVLCPLFRGPNQPPQPAKKVGVPIITSTGTPTGTPTGKGTGKGKGKDKSTSDPKSSKLPFGDAAAADTSTTAGVGSLTF